MECLRRSVFRQLDIDDLITLSLLYDRRTPKEISVFLGLTPPAVSHRLSKYNSLFDEEPFFKKVKNHRVPTEYGTMICEKATKMVEILMGG